MEFIELALHGNHVQALFKGESAEFPGFIRIGNTSVNLSLHLAGEVMHYSLLRQYLADAEDELARKTGDNLSHEP